MGIGITNAGGGTSLNFDVKAYATEALLLAATPKENTIGIISTTAINGWVFSAAEPAAPAQGMVWITVGTSSTVEFNALKKNAIQVYPLSAKQYVEGTWVDVTAMSYQGGEWNRWWNGELYTPGNEWESVTGGWVGKAWRYNSNFTTSEAEAPTVQNNNALEIVTSGPGANQYRSGAAITQKDIDLSGYSKITMVFESTLTITSGYPQICLAVGNRDSDYYYSDAVAINNVSPIEDLKQIELDVSGVNDTLAVYVGIRIQNTSSDVAIRISDIICS